ncbi:MAG: hypothetical protein KDD34_05385 [Bdellovibrionales bacterium]|nr:hypothetical protein [Bdellovibrionales bacterium]
MAFIGCSLFNSNRNQPSSSQPVVRDVPFEARGDEGIRQRILVLPFINSKIGTQSEELALARQALVQDLLRTGRFVVVDAQDFPEDVKKYLTPEGEYNLGEISKKAAEMGLAAVLEGKLLSVKARKTGEPIGIVRDIKAEVTAQGRIRVFSAINGREVLNEVRTAIVESRTTRVLKKSYTDINLIDDPQLTRNAIIQAFRQITLDVVRSVEKLSWEGRVAMLQGERVYINAGRLSGIQIGDILKVTEEGKEIYDPETGRFIGMAPGRMKGTVEIVSYFGKDGSIGIIHSGSGFEENDRVEIY